MYISNPTRDICKNAAEHNVKVQKPCITMIECLDKSEVPIVTMVFLPITKFL